MLRFLQSHPHFLEVIFNGTQALLKPFKRWLKPKSAVERIFVQGEIITKGAIFNCQMCGQCVLHSTGMTCPMNCPKNLRNGPCGGVRANGHCEVIPTMRCVWVEAYERSQHMPLYGKDMLHVLPPLNRQLQNTSAWINDLALPEAFQPKGWAASPTPSGSGARGEGERHD